MARIDTEMVSRLETQLVLAHGDIASRCDCSMLNIEISYGYAPLNTAQWTWTVQLSYILERTKRHVIVSSHADLKTAVDDAVASWIYTRKLHGSAFGPWRTPVEVALPPPKGAHITRSDMTADAVIDADHARRCEALRAAYTELYEAYGESDELDMLGDAVDDYLDSQGFGTLTEEGADHG